MKTILKNVKSIILTVLALMIMTVPVLADEVNENVREARNGVLQVKLIYTDKEGKEYNVGGGSAFLINDDTIVTCYHVLHIEENDENLKWAKENIADFDKKNIKAYVVVRNDVRLEAQLLQESQKADFSILQLENVINNRKILKLEPSNTNETQQVYALGFPDSVSVFQNNNNYTSSDVTISDGRVTKTNESNGVKYVQHSATLSNGYSGGPLVSSDGNVIAINRGTVDENNYSVAIQELTNILDDLAIDYSKGNTGEDSDYEDDTTEETETEEIVTDEVETGEAGTEETETTRAEEIEKPTVEDRKEDDNKGGLSQTMIIAIIAIVVVIILLIIIIIVVMSGKKKSKKQKYIRRDNPIEQPIGRTSGSMNGPMSGPYQGGFDSGAGETTVLNEGAGETTVLGVGANKMILRVKTGERVSVNKPEFVIGRERKRVDYCVADNNSVSRAHVKLVNKDGVLYLMDMNAANGTFVNGTKLQPGQGVRISSGDRFRLSDEEFQVL